MADKNTGSDKKKHGAFVAAAGNRSPQPVASRVGRNSPHYLPSSSAALIKCKTARRQSSSVSRESGWISQRLPPYITYLWFRPVKWLDTVSNWLTIPPSTRCTAHWWTPIDQWSFWTQVTWHRGHVSSCYSQSTSGFRGIWRRGVRRRIKHRKWKPRTSTPLRQHTPWCDF